MQSTAPPGLDVGCLLSSYLLAAVLAAGRQPEAGASDTCRRLRSAVREIWEPSAPHASGRQPASHTRRPLSAGGILHTQAYAVRMKEGVVDAPTVSAAGADAAGFAGCELARTALGYAGARGLPIADADAKAAAEAAALRVAERGASGGEARAWASSPRRWTRCFCPSVPEMRGSKREEKRARRSRGASCGT